jgi:hypothetical protein
LFDWAQSPKESSETEPRNVHTTNTIDSSSDNSEHLPAEVQFEFDDLTELHYEQSYMDHFYFKNLIPGKSLKTICDKNTEDDEDFDFENEEDYSEDTAVLYTGKHDNKHLFEKNMALLESFHPKELYSKYIIWGSRKGIYTS